MDTLAVIDFETTGMAPERGDRATEIAAVLVRDGHIVDRYQSLMRTGARIPAFIEDLTGISNDMVRRARPAAEVMREVADFVDGHLLVAHNASFDRKFWDAELARVKRTRGQEFACTMLISRRIYPDAPNHKLSTLVEYTGVPVAGRFHRALADAEMTAHLLLEMEQEVRRRFQLECVNHELLRAIQFTSRKRLDACVERFRRRDGGQRVLRQGRLFD